VAENCSADRSSDKTNEIGTEGGERCGKRIGIGKKEFTEDQACRSAVQKKVVSFDGGTNRRRDNGLA